jgi:5-methylcytosine-specific restriction endonuclease McrA
MMKSFRQIRDTLVLNRDMMPVSMLPPTSVNWQTAIKAVFLEQAQVVHEYQDWDVHSPSTTLKVPSVIMVRDYVHFEKVIPWNESFLHLRDDYTCQYCLRVFAESHLTQDHVVPRKFGGRTSYENIVSACGPCNHKRGHNIKIQPHRAPYRPSYWELVKKGKTLPLVIPDRSWVDYLDWPEENLFVRGEDKKVVRMKLAA